MCQGVDMFIEHFARDTGTLQCGPCAVDLGVETDKNADDVNANCFP